MKNAMLILYVKNQDASTDFYAKVLGLKPALYVPGMTEFVLNDGSSLGLMPISGIKKLLGEKLPDPAKASEFPKSELYLTVDEPGEFYDRAIKFGAKELSKLQEREWGDAAAYCLDADSHVLVFANKNKQ